MQSTMQCWQYDNRSTKYENVGCKYDIAFLEVRERKKLLISIHEKRKRRFRVVSFYIYLF